MASFLLVAVGGIVLPRGDELMVEVIDQALLRQDIEGPGTAYQKGVHPAFTLTLLALSLAVPVSS